MLIIQKPLPELTKAQLKHLKQTLYQQAPFSIDPLKQPILSPFLFKELAASPEEEND